MSDFSKDATGKCKIHNVTIWLDEGCPKCASANFIINGSHEVYIGPDTIKHIMTPHCEECGVPLKECECHKEYK